MKKFLFLLAFIAQSAFASNGIYLSIDNESVCYKLEEMPTIKHQNDKVLVFVKDKQVLSIANTKTIEITFGEYTSIESIKDAPVKKEGKVLMGGRLIIIKDGKKYDTNGNRID